MLCLSRKGKQAKRLACQQQFIAGHTCQTLVTLVTPFELIWGQEVVLVVQDEHFLITILFSFNAIRKFVCVGIILL